MRVVRTWPRTVPANRSYVVDQLERLVVDGYDQSPIAHLGDDVLIIEWDIAVGLEELDHFVSVIREDPSRVVVAPYRYYTTGTTKGLKRNVWVHRRVQDNAKYGFRHVEPTDQTCHYFGFGMTYLPHALLQAYLQDRDRDTRSSWGFSDGSFSAWHWRVTKIEVPIVWDVRPVHLNYKLPEEGWQ